MTRQVVFILFAFFLTAISLADAPRWQAQEIDPQAGNVVYAVTTADVNNDGKLDVVAVTEDAVLWYENPSWKKHEIIRGKTERDNVCIAAHDIDGDGRVDFALGAGWRPPDTVKPSTLQWLGRDAAGAWQIHPIHFEEPSIHRIRWGDVLGTGKKQLVVVPLQGRGTKGPDWGEGPGARVLVYSIPDDPAKPEWPFEVATDKLHAIHGVHITHDANGQGEIHLAAWEGAHSLYKGDRWQLDRTGVGHQSPQSANKGASEIKQDDADRGPIVATVEPWHGDEIVVYTFNGETLPGGRHVIYSGATWSHAVWFADVDLDGSDELIIGQRDPRKDGKTPKGPGVWVFDLDEWHGDADGIKMQVVDDGGIACEDLLAADLDADGRPDIVAGGRATHNVKIYWNRPAQ